MKRWLIAAAIVLGIAVIGGVGYLGFASGKPPEIPGVVAPNTVSAARCKVEQSASAPGSAILTRVEGIQIPAEGRLAEVLVAAGQKVIAGQPLARMSDAEQYQAAAASAELALVEARRQLQEVHEQAPVRTNQALSTVLAARKKLEQTKSQRLGKNNPRASKNTVDIARANTALAKASMEEAEKAYNDMSALTDNDPQKAAALNHLATARQEYTRNKANLDWLMTGISDLEVAQADSAFTLAQAEVTAAEQAWERVKDGPDQLLLQQAQAKVDQADAKLRQAKQVLENLEIKAPFNGIVTEVKVRVGENLTAGTALFTLIDPNAIEIETTVTAEDLPVLREGMPVNLFFDALPDLNLHGKIKSIIPRRVSGDRPRYNVRVSLDTVPPGLAEGMSADTTIVLEQRENVLCLPRGVVRSSGDNKAVVQVWNGLITEKRTLTVGLRGDKNVEILSGIAEGEKVVVK
jgi:multidrug efflux pump subunit AcrA (membrane-fusion protein)